MNWIQAMNSTVDYIEKNITEKLNIEDISQVAFYSSFHFQRMFHMISGVTVADYVRRRRLTLAAQDLFNGDKVIDVAYRYSYETPEAFTRAFKKMYNVTPKDVKSVGVQLTAYPRLSFQISIKGDKQMDYKLIQHPTFEVMGVRRAISTKDNTNMKQVVAFWDDVIKEGTREELCELVGPLGLLGICYNFDPQMKTFDYLIGVEAKEGVGKKYTKIAIPESTFAVFTAIGPVPTGIQNVINRIYNEWFPSTNYEHAATPEIEVYYPGDSTKNDYRSEVWVPIKKQ